MTATILAFPTRAASAPHGADLQDLIGNAMERLRKLRAIRGITLWEYDEMKRLEQQGMTLDQQLEQIVAARKPRPARRRG